MKLCLASGSAQRFALLAQIGITPEKTLSAEIDESALPAEIPRELVKRLAQEKALFIKGEIEQDFSILAADTVVAVGRRCLPKTQNAEVAKSYLNLLSGRAHRVYTGLCFLHQGQKRLRVVMTRVKMKCLTNTEIESYLTSDEWKDKAGGYAIQGYADCFIKTISGSYSNVVGLPLFETACLLRG